MTEYFKQLTSEEYERLKDAIPLITILVAGADGKFEKEELNWAEKIASIRSYKMSDDLVGFYKDVGINFHEKLEDYVDAFPKNVDDRNDIISDRLEDLNDILPKLDPRVGAHLYDSYLSFAKHVASASGGFWGFFSIGPKEERMMKLPMINPIFFEED